MKLNYKRTFCVGFAFFLICIFWQAYDTLVPKILTDKFGMSQTWSGVIMAMDNVIALLLLPVFGALSDRHNGKKGKRTPFVKVGALFAIALLMLLGVTEYAQLQKVKAISKSTPETLSVLYDNVQGKTLKTPDGKVYTLSETPVVDVITINKADFTSFLLAENNDTKENEEANKKYTDYVVPARQAYAHSQTVKSPAALVAFVASLLAVLIAMASFRSPAVALMPDVTVKPLRSKANAVINLMGSVGGALVLVLGILFGTGKPDNALMAYWPFFGVVGLLMAASLFIFLNTVNEPKFVAEMEKKTSELEIEEEIAKIGKEEEAEEPQKKKLSKAELKSLFLILVSVVFWFMGYNAVTSKYSVYADNVLQLDYNTTLLIANAAAIIAFLPVGALSSKIGRKKAILIGVTLLATSFFIASFMRAGDSIIVMDVLFVMAGIGWATINVNSYPMVVELAKGGDTGKYTGIYYAASMTAQAITPPLSGIFMDMRRTTLFPYAAIFVALAFVTMYFVKHGDNRPEMKKGLEAFADED